MQSVIEFVQAIFNPLVLVFTVSNLTSMGLQVDIRHVVSTVRNPRFAAMVLWWGWVVGPLLGWSISRILPLAEPYATVLLLTSLAPCAPFLPPMLEKARADVNFAGAFVPAAAIGTVVFMPLLAPLLIQGLTLSPIALATPLVSTVLIPLLIGAVIRTYAAPMAAAAFRPVKLIAGLATVLTTLFCLLLYGERMLETTGSFALVAMTVFMVAMAAVTYRFGFGLSEAQRSVMSLGMGTRNIAAVFAGVLAIPNGDPRMIAMVVMWTLWSIVLARLAAPLYARRGVQAH